jgi:hypothetical protein
MGIVKINFECVNNLNRNDYDERYIIVELLGVFTVFMLICRRFQEL